MNKLTLRFFDPAVVRMFELFCNSNNTKYLKTEDDDMTLMQMEFRTKSERSSFISGWSKRSTVTV